MSEGPFQGGAAAVARMGGLGRDGLQIGKEITAATVEVQAASKVLCLQLEVLEKALDKLGKRKAAEVPAPAMKDFLGTAQESHKRCMAQLDLMQKKLMGIDIKAQDLAGTITDLDARRGELQTDFLRQARDRLLRLGSAELKQLLGIQKNLVKELQDGAAATAQCARGITELRKRCKECRDQVDEMHGKLKGIRDLKSADDRLLQQLRAAAEMDTTESDCAKLADEVRDLMRTLPAWVTPPAYDKLRAKALDGSSLVAK